MDFHGILPLGKNATIQKTVQRSDTAANYSEHLNELMSTPAWVDMAIRASIEAVDKHLPNGYITVGHSLQVTHEAPTFLGMVVHVKATLAAIDGNRLWFDIVSWDEVGEIGRGRHERVIVSRDGLLKKAKERRRFLVERNL